MAQLDQRQAVFGGFPHHGRLGAQRLELSRRVAQHIDANIGVPQLIEGGQPLQERHTSYR